MYNNVREDTNMVSQINSVTTEKQSDDLRLIRLAEVMRKIGMGRTWVYAKVADGTFPQPINFGGRAVAWVESEVDAWIRSQIASRTAI